VSRISEPEILDAHFPDPLLPGGDLRQHLEELPHEAVGLGPRENHAQPNAELPPHSFGRRRRQVLGFHVSVHIGHVR
jgi:hypothetical protein